MNPSNDKPMDIVERAVEAMRSLPTPEVPSPELVAATVKALQEHTTPGAPLRFPPRRKPRILRYCAAAAVVFVPLEFSLHEILPAH